MRRVVPEKITASFPEPIPLPCLMMECTCVQIAKILDETSTIRNRLRKHRLLVLLSLLLYARLELARLLLSLLVASCCQRTSYYGNSWEFWLLQLWLLWTIWVLGKGCHRGRARKQFHLETDWGSWRVRYTGGWRTRPWLWRPPIECQCPTWCECNAECWLAKYLPGRTKQGIIEWLWRHQWLD